MTISEHKITATVIPIASTIPAYSVDRPAVQQVFGQGAVGFTAPAGCSVSSGDYGTYSRNGAGGATVVSNAPSSGVDNSGVTGVQVFTRAFSSLTVGYSYTVAVWAVGYNVGGHGVALGVASLGYGPTVVLPSEAGPTYGDEFVQVAYTFTATATTHTVNLRVDFGTSATRRPLLTDDFTLTRDAFTQSYPAQPVPAAPIPLSVIDASVTLDAGYQPYVRATLTCWTPSDLTKVEQIDPRQTGVRVTLRTEANYLGTRPGTSRNYDLLLRGRSLDPDTGTMTLTLSSEEALLQDKKLVALAPERVYGLSVKRAVDYALGKIGKVVAAGFTDANVVTDPIPDPLTNLFTNPSFETNLTGVTGFQCSAVRTTAWAAFGTWSLSLTAPTTGDSFAVVGGDSGAMRNGMVAGRTYTATAYARIPSVITGPVGTRPRCITAFWRVGSATYEEKSSAIASNAVGTTRLSVTFTLPAGATEAFIRFNLGHSGSATMLWDGLTLTEGSTVPEYFDGSTGTALRTTDAWTGTAHNSTSTRTFLPNTDAMIWRPGISASDWLEPLLNSTGLRLYADETNTWRLIPQGTLTDGQVNLSPLNGLTRVSDDIDRDADDWYDSVVVRYFWDDADGKARESFDIAGAPGTKTLLVEINAPMPKFGAAQNHLTAALGKGRTYDIEAISDYWAMPGKQLVLSVPDQQSVVGIIRSVSFAFPSGEMTVGTRGIVETPQTSWLFVPTGKRWQDVATGITWNTYTP